MNASFSPPSFRETGQLDPRSVSPRAPDTSSRWEALAEAGSIVALLAGLEPEPVLPEICSFPALIADAEPWRRERAETAIGDLAAIMEPGMAALLAVNARGADPRPAALALLQEFNAARAALRGLLPAAGTA